MIGQGPAVMRSAGPMPGSAANASHFATDLGKGASGAAVQNIGLMLGLHRGTGPHA